jgi:inositol 2-dehydrogenase
MPKLGVGVIGVGRMGRRHAENLRFNVHNAELVAVADVDSKAARELASELEIEHSYGSTEALLSQRNLDAVVIASPPKFHVPALQAAASAGKHIFCEKPLALTLAEADEVESAVERAGVLLQVGFMRRYDPPYIEAHRRITAGEIGEPVIFKAIGRDREPPPLSYFKSGSGTLFVDAGIHEFDLARWLMKDEVAEVHAFGGAVACPDIGQCGDLDAGIVNLRFTRGAIGNVENFRQSRYGYDIATEVVGTKATLRIGYLQQTALTVLTDEHVSHDVVDHFLVRFKEAYLNEVRDFVKRVLADQSPSISVQDARKALAIALAAESSYREHRPIKVSSGMKVAQLAPHS